MISEMWMLAIFTIGIIALLVLDLSVFHKKNAAMSVKTALLWCCFWISLALSFNILVRFLYGPEKALNFFTGYLVEEALSVDNLFVFLLIFQYFDVHARYQRRVLFWGILGALIMRGIFIFSGIALVTRFHWIIYIFGVFLIITGFRMLFGKDEKIEPEKSLVIRIFRRFFPVSTNVTGKFFIRENGRTMATTLFIVLLVIETTDVIFALDSIPAVLAITTDPFIVYSSNIFAILGLRALYFALAGIMKLFKFLSYGLSVILMFVGCKMLLSEVVHIPVSIALGVIGLILSLSVITSVIYANLTDKKAQQKD
jgi:tellurite resistance protein TerC